MIATGGLARPGRALHRGDRGGRRPAHAHRAAAAARAQQLTRRRSAHMRRAMASWRDARSTETWMLGSLRVPNRVLLAPLAGIGNWFVRLQAKRYGAGMAVSEMVSSHAIHHGNERTCTEMLRIDPRERAAAGPVSIQLFGEDPGDDALGRRARRRAPAPTRSTSTWAARCRRCARPAPARRCSPTPTARSRSRARPSQGAGERRLPVTVKLRSGLRPGEHERLRARPPPGRRGGRRRDRLPPALGRRAPQGRARLRARRAARRVAARAGDPHRRPERRRAACARRSRGTGAAAVMLARGALGNPWLFARAARRARAPSPRRAEVLAELDWTIDRAVEHLGEQRARRATCASSTPGTSPRLELDRRRRQAPAGIAADGAERSRDVRRAAGRSRAGARRALAA